MTTLVAAPVPVDPVAQASADALRLGASDRYTRTTRSTSRTPLPTVASAVTRRSAALAKQRQVIEKKQAAQQQVIEKKAAAAAAAKKAATVRNERRIRAQGYQPGTTDPRAIARQIMGTRYGWGSGEFSCYDKLVVSESGWQVDATNPSSGAYGIPQSLPAEKMASAGSDWRTNPATQISWGLGYVKATYDTPCRAWSFKQGNNWY